MSGGNGAGAFVGLVWEDRMASLLWVCAQWTGALLRSINVVNMEKREYADCWGEGETISFLHWQRRVPALLGLEVVQSLGTTDYSDQPEEPQHNICI